MSRNIKISQGEYYHIYNRGTDKRVIFTDKIEHQRFLALLYICNSEKNVRLDEFTDWNLNEILSISINKKLVAIGSYCLMPNHFHILIKEIEEGGISKFMQKFMTAYVMYFNKKHHRNGALFEGPFKAEHVSEDRYLKYLYAYIHLNPIGIIDKGWKQKKIQDRKKAKEFLLTYEYSSLFDYLKLQTRSQEKVLSKKEFPKYFETPQKFNEMIDEWMNFSKSL